jgi:hypothetical protein
VCLGSVCETLLIGGTASFGAKIIQEFFNVDLATAGTIMGIFILIQAIYFACSQILKLYDFQIF